MSKKILIVVIVLIVVIGAVFMMIRDVPMNRVTPTPLPTQSPLLGVTESADPNTTGELKEITITAKQYSFQPAEIRVKVGDRIKLTLNNVDVVHGIAIPEFGVNFNAQVGTPQSAEFTADKAGTFLMFCSVFCGSGHKDMRGMLIVE